MRLRRELSSGIPVSYGVLLNVMDLSLHLENEAMFGTFIFFFLVVSDM